MKFYLDCKFDGHNGPLLSLALVGDDGTGLYIETNAEASDPWVIANVVPLMRVPMNVTWPMLGLPVDEVGTKISMFLGNTYRPTIVADSPVDIARFCRAISTATDGSWASVSFPLMTFEVHNVDCYPTDLPGAIQYNAWWDAKALQWRLSQMAEAVRLGGSATDWTDGAQSLVQRITDYLSIGGLFNPELMSGRETRDLLIDCRDVLRRSPPPVLGLTDVVAGGREMSLADLNHLSDEDMAICLFAFYDDLSFSNAKWNWDNGYAYGAEVSRPEILAEASKLNAIIRESRKQEPWLRQSLSAL